MNIRSAEVLEGYNPDMELIVNYKPKMMVKTHGVIGTYEQLFESIAEIFKDADYEDRKLASEGIRNLQVDKMEVGDKLIFY
jgi:hypothetical protein